MVLTNRSFSLMGDGLDLEWRILGGVKEMGNMLM